MYRARLVLPVAMSWLAGCHLLDLSTFADRADAVEARQITDTLARGDVATTMTRLDESQRTPDPENSLKLLAAEFPRRAPTAVRLVGYQTNVSKAIGGSTTETSSVTFESNYDSTHVVTNVVLRRVNDGERRIVGLHVQSLPSSLDTLNALSLEHAGIVQYAFLLAMIAVVATIVIALVSWVRRRRITRRKWWWLVAILVGVAKVSLNWTTGAVAFGVFSVQLLGFSATRDGLVGPWILSLSIPPGAIAFMINARRERRRQQPLEPPPASPDDIPATAASSSKATPP